MEAVGFLELPSQLIYQLVGFRFILTSVLGKSRFTGVQPLKRMLLATGKCNTF